MALDRDARRRFARQISLPEVGEEGQARLLASSVSVTGDARAVEVAELYLSRSGVGVAGEPAIAVGSREAIEALAGRAELVPAAAFVAGAFAAVEAIKRALEVGTPGRLDVSLAGPKERA